MRELLDAIRPSDEEVRAACQALLDLKTKPRGSLGEGSGAALALLNEMASFESAGVTDAGR